MSELASSDFDQLEHVGEINRRFEVIVDNVLDDALVPIFTEKWPSDIDIDQLLARRPLTMSEGEPSVESKIPISSGQRLLTEILRQIGTVHEKSELKSFQKVQAQLKASDENKLTTEDNHLLTYVTRLINIHDSSLEIVAAATDEYESLYWEDYSNKTGQNSELLGVLYEVTAPYEESSLLNTIQQIRERGGLSDEIVLEADRIARIIVGHQAGVLE